MRVFLLLLFLAWWGIEARQLGQPPATADRGGVRAYDDGTGGPPPSFP